jgi:hypothetical protein
VKAKLNGRTTKTPYFHSLQIYQTLIFSKQLRILPVANQLPNKLVVVVLSSRTKQAVCKADQSHLYRGEVNSEWTNLMSLVLIFHYLLLKKFRMLVHPSSGACYILWIYFMCCISLVRFVLVLRCGSPGMVWYPYVG